MADVVEPKFGRGVRVAGSGRLNASLLRMTRSAFLPWNLALAFYNLGTIWAHEVDIFRTWTLLIATIFITD
jgi:hypothetical protein